MYCMHSLLAEATNATFWLPKGVSSVASDVDWLFYFTYWVTIFFFVLILGLVVVFALKYRHRPGHEPCAPGPSHNNALEVIWTVIPTILVFAMFYWGVRGYMDMTIAPPDAMEIQVTGKMWTWEFTYPNGHTDSELHIPVGMPVRFVLNSEDVIHSFAIPAFRLRKDVVPRRYNKLWVQATEEGTYPVYCDQYCGISHSRMISEVKVEPMSSYRAWLVKASNWETTMTPLEAGEHFYKTKGCMACHSVDGTRIIGPSFKDVFGDTVEMNDGSKVLADENYVHESIREPSAKVVKGFQPVMPPFTKESLPDKDINAIIWYLKSKSSHFKGDMGAGKKLAAPVEKK